MAVTEAQLAALEVLASGPHSRSMLGIRAGYPGTIQLTVRALWRRGLITPEDDRCWSITPKGRRRLAREGRYTDSDDAGT